MDPRQQKNGSFSRHVYGKCGFFQCFRDYHMGFTRNVLFHKISGNFSPNVFELADISEHSYWESALLGRCGSGISKDDGGGAEDVPWARVWSGLYDPEMWRLCLPPVAAEKVGWNDSLLLPPFLSHFITILEMYPGNSLWSLRALASSRVAHTWPSLCKAHLKTATAVVSQEWAASRWR